ncbi:MAG: elongation factor G [Rhizobiaceae bacterium]
MGKRSGDRSQGPKCVAIVGPFASGKTSLFEALLARTGSIAKQARAGSGNTVGDHSPEAKSHKMSVEATIATTSFMGESITFIDCPGSVEFAYEAEPVLAAADMAIVVAEADEKKLPALQLALRRLDDLGIPHVLFLNKIDKASQSVRDTLKLLQPVSRTPMLLRQIPIWKDGIATGYIDLALERAFVYREHAHSQMIPLSGDDAAREIEARYSMLERLADHDDELMEQLLSDIAPPKDEVFDDLAADLREGLVMPVFIGAAERGNGVSRLLKAIRHEGPDWKITAKRLGISGGTVAQVMKTIHTSHAGKLSVARVFNGAINDAAELTLPDGASERVSGIFALTGLSQKKLAGSTEGETVALGKLEHALTGQTLSTGKTAAKQLTVAAPPTPVMSVSALPKERKDEVKLSAALHRIAEEDPSLQVHHAAQTAETILGGQGEMHLRVVLERLSGRYAIPIETKVPLVAWRETITKQATHRARHRKQSGGHGQFGDVQLDIKPLARGAGFEFTDTITGGVVPKNYIPSVEEGVRDFLKAGPLGFPLVDLAVNLSDGSYHSVDSSDMAFQMAAKLCLREAMSSCASVLLEPVMKVEVVTPESGMAAATGILTQRRGQILGFNPRDGWEGWNVIEALAPESELRGLIVELRSATSGVASYTASFSHMAELAGRMADDVIKAHGKRNVEG